MDNSREHHRKIYGTSLKKWRTVTVVEQLPKCFTQEPSLCWQFALATGHHLLAVGVPIPGRSVVFQGDFGMMMFWMILGMCFLLFLNNTPVDYHWIV